MRLVAAAAAIALSSLVGLTVAARAAANPSCPAAPSGYFLDPNLPTQSGSQGPIPWFRCNFTSTNQANGFFWVELQWAKAGTVDTTDPGCTLASTEPTMVASTSYWGFADVGGWRDAQSRQVALATAKSWLSALSGIARSCSSTSAGGSVGTKRGSIRKECPQRKPVIKESDAVAERLTFTAAHQGSPGLTVSGAAALSSFYCFYSGGTHDRVGTAKGLVTIVRTGAGAFTAGIKLAGFPVSSVKGGTITDTVTGTVITPGAPCKVGSTVTFTIVKTRTSSQVSFAGACGRYTFTAAESNATLG